MLVKFTKMHGLGNDFVVIDALTYAVQISPEKVRQLADRHYGIGCDQLLLVEAPSDPSADFGYKIYNADGSLAEQCGNGARCFAKFVFDKKLIAKRDIILQTQQQNIHVALHSDEKITVDMGEPILCPEKIPFSIEKSSSNAVYEVFLPEKNDVIEMSILSMGNPHAVVNCADIPLKNSLWKDSLELGEIIQQHTSFPNSCNVSFMEIESRDSINLRVLERGVGETLACGSAACATMAAAYLKGLINSKVAIHLIGGVLEISWKGPGSSLSMTGPATTVFEGQFRC